MHSSVPMSSVPCSKLTENMAVFCEVFFYKLIDGYGSVSEIIQEGNALRTDVFSAADRYNDSVFGSRGIGVYLSNQGKWYKQMISKWRSLSLSFVRRLKNSIRRPVLKLDAHNSYPYWKVPLRIKLHLQIVYISQFLEFSGYCDLFNEEFCEYFQETRKYLRLRNFYNIHAGAEL